MGAKLVWMRWDAGAGAFEGRVDVETDGRTFRYPCRAALPADAELAQVEAALVAHAARQRASDRPLAVPSRSWREALEPLARLLHIGPAAVPVPARAPVRPRAARP